jgi:hypothetical protein
LRLVVLVFFFEELVVLVAEELVVLVAEELVVFLGVEADVWEEEDFLVVVVAFFVDVDFDGVVDVVLLGDFAGV